MSKRFSGGFGYGIDYKAAIEEDERNVRRYEADGVVAVTQRWAAWATSARAGWTFNNALDIAVAAGLQSKETLQEFIDELRRAGAELGSADVLGPVLFDNVDQEFIPEWTEGLPFRPSLADKTTDALYYIEVRTEDSRKEALSKAKASLARHRRNQAKNGA